MPAVIAMATTPPTTTPMIIAVTLLELPGLAVVLQAKEAMLVRYQPHTRNTERTLIRLASLSINAVGSFLYDERKEENI